MMAEIQYVRQPDYRVESDELIMKKLYEEEGGVLGPVKKQALAKIGKRKMK